MNDSELIALYSAFEDGSPFYSFWQGARSNTGDIDEQELCIYFKDKAGNYVKELQRYGDLKKAGYRDDFLFTLGMMSGPYLQDLDEAKFIVSLFLNDVKAEYKKAGVK